MSEKRRPTHRIVAATKDKNKPRVFTELGVLWPPSEYSNSGNQALTWNRELDEEDIKNFLFSGDFYVDVYPNKPKRRREDFE